MKLVEPYLFFEGRCEEALAFYEKALGAKVQMKMRYSESPEGNGACPRGLPPGSENKIMHALFTIGDANVMASAGQRLLTAVFLVKALGGGRDGAGKLVAQ